MQNALQILFFGTIFGELKRMDLSLKSKMLWFAQFNYFLNLYNPYWKNISTTNPYYLRAVSCGNNVEDSRFQAIFTQRVPAVPDQPNFFVKKDNGV